MVAATVAITSLYVPVAHAAVLTMNPATGVVDAGQPLTVSSQDASCIGAVGAEAFNGSTNLGVTAAVAADGSFTISNVGSIVAPGSTASLYVTCYNYSGLLSTLGMVQVTVNPFPRAVVPMPVVYFASWLTVTGSGFLPGESVNLTLFSTPVNIGDQNADNMGNVTFSFALPPTIEIGNHHNALLTGSVSGTAQRVEFAVIPRSSGTSPSTPRMPSLGSDVA